MPLVMTMHILQCFEPRTLLYATLSQRSQKPSLEPGGNLSNLGRGKPYNMVFPFLRVGNQIYLQLALVDLLNHSSWSKDAFESEPVMVWSASEALSLR
jgi:hypothetical protein